MARTGFRQQFGSGVLDSGQSAACLTNLTMTSRPVNGATLRGAGRVSPLLAYDLSDDLRHGKKIKAYYVVHCVNIGSISGNCSVLTALGNCGTVNTLQLDFS